jgi:hypothetical protein
MMEAVHTSETSVNFYEAIQSNAPEGHSHTRRHENLKSHLFHMGVKQRRMVKDKGAEEG